MGYNISTIGKTCLVSDLFLSLFLQSVKQLGVEIDYISNKVMLPSSKVIELDVTRDVWLLPRIVILHLFLLYNI